jgi:hypothetical protein
MFNLFLNHYVFFGTVPSRSSKIVNFSQDDLPRELSFVAWLVAFDFVHLVGGEDVRV